MLRKTRHWLQECSPAVRGFLDAYGREEMTSEELTIAFRHLQVQNSNFEIKEWE